MDFDRNGESTGGERMMPYKSRCVMKTHEGHCYFSEEKCDYRFPINCDDYREHILPRERILYDSGLVDRIRNLRDEE